MLQKRIFDIYIEKYKMNLNLVGGENMATWKCKECGALKEGRCRPQKCEKCGAPKEAIEKKE